MLLNIFWLTSKQIIVILFLIIISICFGIDQAYFRPISHKRFGLITIVSITQQILFLVHLQIHCQPPVTVGRIGLEIIFNFILHHQIPCEHFTLMVNIFRADMHTLSNELFVMTHLNDLYFFSLSQVPA